MSAFTPDRLRALMGIGFSDRQMAAITAPLEPCVIMAGAGSGKTSVMTARIVWLVATGAVQPQHILGLTFTNKAAAEFRTRVRDALAHPDLATPFEDAATIGTYHSFAQQLLADDGIRIGLEPEAQLLPDVRRDQLAMRVVREPGQRIVALSHSTTSVVQQLIALDGRLAEEAVDVEAVRRHDLALLERMAERPQQSNGQRIMETARRRLELLGLVEAFRAAKLREQAIDYSDLMRHALALVTQRADVVERLRGDFRVVLLDEYQDTSVAQRLLMQRAFGDGHPVTAVGDALQAIYEWRGASAVNILDFPSHFPTRDGRPATVHGLPTTQRFGPRIAELANDITASLREGMTGVEPLEAADAVRNGPGSIDVALHPDRDREFAWIAAQLRAAHADTDWGDMAVLLREHRHAPAVLDALAAADIPAQIVGKQGLLAVPDVADVVAYLRVLHDPAANPSWVRILAGMRYRIGMRDIAHLGRRARDIAASIAERGAGWRAALADASLGSDVIDLVAIGDAVADPGPAPISPEARERIARLRDEVAALRRQAGLPIGELVRLVIRRIGLDVELDASDRSVDRSRRASLDAFLELTAGFTSLDASQSLSAFLRWLDDGERMGQQAQVDQPIVRGAVSIMTVHAAKGLQRKVVALPALVEGAFPSNRGEQAWPTNADAVPYAVLHNAVDAELLDYPSDTPRDKEARAFAAALRPRKLAEETRLAYVAVTRAERRLIASAARDYEGRAAEPSRYLLAIRDAAVARGGTVHLWADAGEVVDGVQSVGVVWPQRLDEGYAARLAEAVAGPMGSEFAPDASERAVIDAWDAAIEARTRAELSARRAVHDVPLPAALTTTELQRLIADPDGYLQDLVRPMPKAPAPAARRGSAFHAWVERQFSGQLLLGLDDGDALDDDADLAALVAAFQTTDWARRTPLALELPFVLGLGGHAVRGRIDAVYRDGDGIIVVDWKTNARASADPLQLAVYRRAAAARFGVPLEQVRSCFVYVAQGRTEWHDVDAPVEALLAASVGQR